ncbi:MAG: DUF4199 domain-containing protein [Bacteroidales bacterium]|nr:DUF4199 domain-containing protein [Bacteroidales bacterium]
MEENKVSIGKTALTYGLALGGILILLELLFYSFDLDPKSKIRWVSILVLIGAVVIGVKNFRDKDLNGYITYGKSVSLSFLIGIYSAVLVSIFMFFFITYIDPGMIDVILEQAEEEILKTNPNMSDQEFDMAMSYTEKFTTPVWITIWSFLALTVQAIIAALIISIFMKKNDDSLDAIIN